ncbi:MAG: DNA cytosine methyltransferase [Nostoc sp. LLA-1]|nr:DNA cytosine methyltransferase [Cyanocohniella sp. LLY]
MKSVLSLFSGIGGLCHHGIAAAGLSHKFQVKQFVEISPYSQSQLRHEQPQIPIHPDINTYQCHRGQFNIVCGGFPCSGTSNSGNRQGLADFRSALWTEQFRIINQCRPAIALIENPTGLLARGMATILKDLSQIGYVCEWETIPAYCLGLPHSRERVFIITYPDGLFYRQQPTPWADQVRNHIEKVWLSVEIRSFEPGVRAVAHGLPIGVAKNIPGNYDARRAYGLSCSPRQAAVAWKRIDYLCSLLSQQEAIL